MAADDLEELDTVLSNSSTQDDVDQGGDADASIEGEKCPLHNQSPSLHTILTAKSLTLPLIIPQASAVLCRGSFELIGL